MHPSLRQGAFCVVDLIKTFKIIGWTAGSLLVCWLIVLMATQFLQDKLVFQSRKLPADHVFTFNQKFSEHSIETKDGETLSALFFPADSASKGLILYFHGNAGNLQRWGDYAPDFTSLRAATRSGSRRRRATASCCGRSSSRRGRAGGRRSHAPWRRRRRRLR